MLKIFADDGRMDHPWYIRFGLKRGFGEQYSISTPVYDELLALQKPTPELRPKKKANKEKNLPKHFLPKPAYKGA
jgi:hypothetical protein